MDITTVVCLPCAAGWCFECIYLDGNNCCCSSPVARISSGERTLKADEEVTDPKSTGRKRAAVLYPIADGMVCEWAGLKYACGGKFPIVGCLSNPATHRHHGPDKNTLNNDVGNVHRICVHCHNRWHTLNDPVYDEFFGTDEWLKHDPVTQATPEEILMNEVRWSSKQKAVEIKEEEH